MVSYNMSQELTELRLRAKVLGVKNTENMDTETLNERIGVMLKVRLEGLTRLEFDENNQIVPSLENLRILQIEAVEPKHGLTREDVIQKLKGYRLLTNKLDTTNKRWTRYISKKDGMLRAGGFPIRNKPTEEFIVMKNVSKKFTFSINRDNVILMEKLPQDSLQLLSDTVLTLINEYRNKVGHLFVALSDNFDTLVSGSNVSSLAKSAVLNRGGLGKAFRLNKIKYKNFFIFKLTKEDFDLLNERVDTLTPEDKLGNRGVSPEIMQIVNEYYAI